MHHPILAKKVPLAPSCPLWPPPLGAVDLKATQIYILRGLWTHHRIVEIYLPSTRFYRGYEAAVENYWTKSISTWATKSSHSFILDDDYGSQSSVERLTFMMRYDNFLPFNRSRSTFNGCSASSSSTHRPTPTRHLKPALDKLCLYIEHDLALS